MYEKFYISEFHLLTDAFLADNGDLRILIKNNHFLVGIARALRKTDLIHTEITTTSHKTR